MSINQIKRYLLLILTSIIIWSSVGIDPAFAAYKKPYYITVDITNQIVTIYNTSDGSIARQMLCSTGMNDSTPTGTWYMASAEKSDERREWYYFKSFNCYAKYASRIFYQYFFHSITYNRKSNSAMSSSAIKAFGTPASHGCIRLRVEDAKFIAQQCKAGTKCTIYKSGERDEELRELLYVSTYVQSEMPYSEFLGVSADSLGRGCTGEEVAKLQLRLHDLGYYDSAYDAVYNAETIAAVKELQQDIGMTRNGIVSAELSELIYSEDAPVSDGLITLREKQTGPIVKKLQQALTNMKLYTGPIDGVYDIEVCIAVDLFQSICGYTVDGATASPELQQGVYYETEKIIEEIGEDFSISKEEENYYASYVSTPNKVRINVRSQPDTESSSVGQVKDGEMVLCHSVNGDWVQITCRAGTGFIMKKYLTNPFVQTNTILVFTAPSGKTYRLGRTVEEAAAGQPSEAQKIAAYIAQAQYGMKSEEVEYCRVNTGSENITLNLREDPSSEGKILGTVTNGTELRVISKDENWTQVCSEDIIGYLMNDYLTFETVSSDNNAESAENSVDNGDTESTMADVSAEGITAVVVPDKSNRKVSVYDRPEDDASVIGSLSADSEVGILGVDEETGWCLIYKKGKQGYVRDVNLMFKLGN